ncbi:MAG: hypothetical protein GEU93_19635 [Propionibacteriales bacterium]|nr:hypothetical protein [Propionibacteriales bacterium]
MTTTHATTARFGAIGVALAPLVMLVALIAHPYLVRLPDAAAVAEAVEANTRLWGWVHLLTAVGSGLVALAFLAIRARLRDAGEERFSTWALPFVIAGSILYGLLPALEFAPMATASTGGDVAAVQTALEPWFIAILVTSVITFAVGIYGFARGVAASRILSPSITRLVVTALVLLALSRFVPLGAVQFYLQAIAGVVALWPLAFQMWRESQGTRVTTRRSVIAG